MKPKQTPKSTRTPPAREILGDFKGERLDYFVSGYGTGGTVVGVGRTLECGFRIAGGKRRITEGLDKCDDRVAEIRVIFDDEDGGAHATKAALPLDYVLTVI